MALFSPLSVLAAAADAVDRNVVRGLPDGDRRQHEQPSAFARLLTCRPLLIFTRCVVPFHLAPAAVPPLFGQKLALENKYLGTAAMSVCSLRRSSSADGNTGRQGARPITGAASRLPRRL